MSDAKSILPDWRERDCIQNDLDVNLLVEAAAGTGKTTSLIARTINLIQEGKCTVDTLTAVTFTRKAAAEMRARFQLELEKRLRFSTGAVQRRLSGALSRIDRCFIGTIHSFCGRLLRERPIEAGVDIAFREIEDVEDRAIRREAWDECVANLYASNDPILDELREAGIEIGILYNAFSTMADYPDVDEWPHPQVKIPDLEPYRKALMEYVSHMKGLEPSLPDDPGNDSLIAQYKNLPRIVEYRDLSNLDSFMKVMDEFKKCKIVQKNWPDGKEQALGELQRWEEFCETRVVPLQNMWLAFRYDIGMRAVLPAIQRYEEIKKQKGVLNFQDLLLYTARMLKRWPQVRKYFQERITHLLVDEFQDTDPIQAEIMLLLTSDDLAEVDWRNCRPRPGSLFVVGDPKQSIYRFRRADIVTYNLVKSIISNNGGQVLHLSSNFRTDSHILEWVNGVMSKEFPETETPYSPIYVPLQHGRNDSSIPSEQKIQKLLVPSEYKKNEGCIKYESELIAKWIFEEIRSNRAEPGDFMIVSYLTKNLNVYARKLERLQIPCQVTGGDALNQVEELRLLMLCLNAVSQSWNPVALVALLRSELFGFSDPELYSFKENGGVFSFLESIPNGLRAETKEKFKEVYVLLRRYKRWIENLPHSAAVEMICNDLGLFAFASGYPGADGRCGCLAKTIDLVRSSQDQFNSFSNVIDYLNQIVDNAIKLDGSTAAALQKSVVRVMNLHKVKGLEAPIVFLADPTGKFKHTATLHIDRGGEKTKAFFTMEEVNPRSFQRKIIAKHEKWNRFCDEEQRYLDAEKVRLLYVAATRCGRRLIVTQREKGNHNNPWDFFSPSLSDKNCLEPLSTEVFREGTPKKIVKRDFEDQLSVMNQRYQNVILPTYSVLAMRQKIEELDIDLKASDDGEKWGLLIHSLLEDLVRRPDKELAMLIDEKVDRNKLNPEWKKRAERVVRKVVVSDVWRRSENAERRVAEIPIRYLQSASQTMTTQTIFRGVVDLAFKEENGWTLVDYKTDVAAKENVQELLDKYRPQIQAYADAWRRVSGENVKEAGLYFTETYEYLPIAIDRY